MLAVPAVICSTPPSHHALCENFTLKFSLDQLLNTRLTVQVLGWEAHLTRYLSKPSFQKELGRVRETFFHDVIPWSRQEVRHNFTYIHTMHREMGGDRRPMMDGEDDMQPSHS